jgi:hypothetical protein
MMNTCSITSSKNGGKIDILINLIIYFKVFSSLITISQPNKIHYLKVTFLIRRL